MCHLGGNQLITVYRFSLLCEMDESTSRFRIPKISDEEKTSIINSVPKFIYLFIYFVIRPRAGDNTIGL